MSTVGSIDPTESGRYAYVQRGLLYTLVVQSIYITMIRTWQLLQILRNKPSALLARLSYYPMTNLHRQSKKSPSGYEMKPLPVFCRITPRSQKRAA